MREVRKARTALRPHATQAKHEGIPGPAGGPFVFSNVYWAIHGSTTQGHAKVTATGPAPLHAVGMDYLT